MPTRSSRAPSRTPRRPAHKPWTPADIALLRQLAGKHPRRIIARRLKRSDGATGFKAFKLRLSLLTGRRIAKPAVRKSRR